MLEKLNGIVWPAVANLVGQEIKTATEKGLLNQKSLLLSNDWKFIVSLSVIIYVYHFYAGVSVCIIEAALLLEANWKGSLNEIWVSTIPVKEVKTNEDRQLSRVNLANLIVIAVT